MPSRRPQPNHIGLILGSCLILISVGLFQFGDSLANRVSQKDLTPHGREFHSAIDQDQAIDKHVQESNFYNELHAHKNQLEIAARMRETQGLVKKDQAPGQPLPLDTAETRAANERSATEAPRARELPSPRDIIYNELADQQFMRKLQEERKADFLRRYIESARRKGYKVELNDDGTVRSVTPIRKAGIDPANDPASFDAVY
jgi:uncharacterized membrane protein YccC